MVKWHEYPYGCPHSLNIYMGIDTDIRTDVRVELFVLRTVRPGSFEARTVGDPLIVQGF